MANIIDSLNINGNIGLISLPYVECTSAIDSTNKTVTIANGFALEDGAQIIVRFSNGNSVTENVTLNVNGTGAKAINSPIELITGDTTLLVYNSSSTSWKIVNNIKPITLRSWTSSDIGG